MHHLTLHLCYSFVYSVGLSPLSAFVAFLCLLIDRSWMRGCLLEYPPPHLTLPYLTLAVMTFPCGFVENCVSPLPQSRKDKRAESDLLWWNVDIFKLWIITC